MSHSGTICVIVGHFLLTMKSDYARFILEVTDSLLSAVQNSGKVLAWGELIELIDDAEAAVTRLRHAVVDDKHVLEARIRLLERDLRESGGNRG